MVQFNILLIVFYCSSYVEAYRNRLYTIANLDESRTREYKCKVYEGLNKVKGDLRDNQDSSSVPTRTTSSDATNDTVENPYELFQNFLHKFLYGMTVEIEDEHNAENKLKSDENNKTDYMRHYVFGNYFHAELFNNRSGVHLPQLEYIHRGHCSLIITRDYMQTAVNAFAIFLYGTIDDIKRLPADYVLRSIRSCVEYCGHLLSGVAKCHVAALDSIERSVKRLIGDPELVAISMMKIAREKLAATWNIVKENRSTEEITYETLEIYRPLFKYINGREIARLNLTDDRILTYIGTHADLDRHQVGVVASKYIEVNPKWTQPKYLNLMNNLICGVPMTFMRKLPENTYLQLSHQVFYHIRACDPLQRRFFLSMMTRTQALGKSYSWNARDVSRLGVLLAEVDGEDLSLIKPEAMSGIASQVMQHIPVQHLKYLTVIQLEHLARKSLNIFIRKLKFHEEEIKLYGSAALEEKSNLFLYTMIFIIFFVIN